MTLVMSLARRGLVEAGVGELVCSASRSLAPHGVSGLTPVCVDDGCKSIFEICSILLTSFILKPILSDMRTKRLPESEPLEVTQFVTQVGARIRVMRVARRISQTDLAERAELSRATIGEIEKGSLRTRFSDIARLLWALDDSSLQKALASAAEDPIYQDAVRASFPKTARRTERST